jgi:hypothetical protein
MQVEEESSVTLSCELSRPGLAAEWRRGLEVLKSGLRHQVRRREGVMELTVRNALLEDSGVYCCVYGDALTTANLTVTRKETAASAAKSLLQFTAFLYAFDKYNFVNLQQGP